MVTQAASWDYRDAHEGFARTYFRRWRDGLVGSIGMGTYLGPATDERDASYRDALVAGFERGANVVDTAINYRHQRSERVVGRAIEAASVDRDALFVSTKGGFVPFDGERPDDPSTYVRDTYVRDGPLSTDDLARGHHALDPDFLADQLDRSLANLDLSRIDCYYVHVPETQLAVRSREAVYDQLEAAFERLERRAAAGDLSAYGVATWDAFRVPSDHERYLSLPTVVERAREAAGAAGNDATHFGAVQLPFNVSMADAFTVDAHEGPDGDQSALAWARAADLPVFASAPLAQGALAEGLPDDVAERCAGSTPAQRALNFARSAPGVRSAVVGSGTVEHVTENVAAGEYEPLGARAFDAVFE